MYSAGAHWCLSVQKIKTKFQHILPSNFYWWETLIHTSKGEIVESSGPMRCDLWLKLLSCDALLSDVCSSMALSRVRRMERLRVSVETRAQISLGDARRSERASGESLRKACPALLSVMSGFIRRDRGLNCINSRLFPIVFGGISSQLKLRSCEGRTRPGSRRTN